MTQILAIRNKITEIYQKVSLILRPLAKFLVYFIAFYGCNKLVGFGGKFSSSTFVVLFAAISAFLPAALGYVIMTLYIVLQLYSVSWIIAATVFIISAVLYCFFIRYVSKYSMAIVTLPAFMGINIPYVYPITFGLLTTPVAIVPTCLGVFAYYFLKGINYNIGTIEQVKDADNPFELYINVMNSVLKNQTMIVTMIVFSIVIVVVYLIRNIKMDYAFEIATGSGCVTAMLGFIILGLKFETSISIGNVVLFSILSALISYVICFVYRPLSYAAVENVQFEDDDYYYYVRAVPKIKAASKKVTYKHIINPSSGDGYENFGMDEELDYDDEDMKIASAKKTQFSTAGRVDKEASVKARAVASADNTIDKKVQTGVPQSVRNVPGTALQTAGKTATGTVKAQTKTAQPGSPKVSTKAPQSATPKAPQTGNSKTVSKAENQTSDRVRTQRPAGETSNKSGGNSQSSTVRKTAPVKTAPVKTAENKPKRPNV